MSKEVIKMKQGMSYSCKEKTIILNVFKYFRKTYPDKCVTEIVRCTAKATGCSEKSIFRFRKEEISPEGFKEPSKTKTRKNININSRIFKYDDSVRDSIKGIIFNLKCKKIVPSLNTILRNINSTEHLPKFSLMTLRRLLFDMGFTYEKEKTSNKSFLVDKSDNKDIVPEEKSRNITPPPGKSTATQDISIKQDNQQIIPEVMSQNQIYLPSHSRRQIPVHLPRDNCMIEPMPLGYQHTMLFNHRIMHSHNMGFIHHPHQPHNTVMHQ